MTTHCNDGVLKAITDHYTVTGRLHGSVKKILEVGVSEAWGFFCDQPIT